MQWLNEALRILETYIDDYGGGMDQKDTLRYAEDELYELKEHLKDIEFVERGCDEYNVCPVCHAYETVNDHNPDCWLHLIVK
jgi:hypothetical protein